VGVIACMSVGCSVDKHGGNMLTVTSKDGTTIAYDKSGKGPAVIFVVGALASRSDHDKLAKLLSADFTVYNYDRRGRGDSGDNERYETNREIEDIAALIDEAGGSAYIYGVSSGACLALEAAASLGDKVKKLAIYEAPYDEADSAAEKWKVYSSKINQLLTEGRRGDAVEYHLRFVGVPGAALAAMKVSPGWSKMKELAPTIAYDIKVVGENRSIPVERLSAIQANSLVIDGGESLEPMPFMSASADKIAKAIPNARRRTIEGESHVVDEKAIAPVLKDFFNTLHTH
jgi:pimeloyl-ACP methyl ester carboxylesterase